MISLSDIIAFVALIISIYCSTIVVRDRSQRDFFMDEYRDLKNRYRDFITEIRNDKLSSQTIRDELSQFSGRIKSLEKIVESEYSLTVNNLYDKHSCFQNEVTDFDSINDQYSEPYVSFTPEEKVQIENLYREIDNSIIGLIVGVNRASQIKPWNRQEENLGF